MNKEYRIEGFFEGRPISIWEMRNPIIYLDYARFMCDYNFNSVACKKIQEFWAADENDMFVHKVLREWAPSLQKKLPEMKAALKSANFLESLKSVEAIEETFLFEGYIEHYEKLIPKPSKYFPIVMAHNDAQENNILIH
jgi:hypothetical protein